MITIREVIQILGVGLLALGVMLAPRGVPRDEPFLKETGFTSMAESGAFAETSKMLLLIGAGVFVISFIPLPRWRGKPSTLKKPKNETDPIWRSRGRAAGIVIEGRPEGGGSCLGRRL